MTGLTTQTMRKGMRVMALIMMIICVTDTNDAVSLKTLLRSQANWYLNSTCYQQHLTAATDPTTSLPDCTRAESSADPGHSSLLLTTSIK